MQDTSQKDHQPAGEHTVDGRALFRTVAGLFDEELLLVDAGGRVLDHTDGLGGCFGEGSAELQQVRSEGLKDFLARVKNDSSSPRVDHFGFEVPGEESEADREFEATVLPMDSAQGRQAGYLVVARSLGGRVPGRVQREMVRRAQARSTPSHSEMFRHEKMVALGTLAAGVAHEIGNPLASLSAVVQLLKRQIRSGKAADHVETLDEQIQRITRIVRQMLEFSRPSPEEQVPTDVDELVERTVKMVGYSQRARRPNIVSSRNRELPKLRIMPQLFQQVVVNLLLNALDAVDESEDRGTVRIERRAEGGTVKVIVTDTGVGMSRNQVSRAFEPFYTTKPPRRGTGLGLAVSYRLIERHGGDISIDSEPGRGTVVTVALPVDEAEPGKEDPGDSAETENRGG